MGLFKRSEPEKTEIKTEEDLLTALGANEKIDWKKAMQIPAFSACVELIANTVGMIPIKLYERKEDGIHEVIDDRVRLLNTDPGDTLDAMQLKKALIRDYFNKGGFAYIRKSRNKVISIHYVDRGSITIQNNTDPIFKSYSIMVEGKKYEAYNYIKILRNTKNGWSSESIVDENQEILATAYATLGFQKKLVNTNGMKGGYLKSEKTLTDEALTKLKKAWAKLYSGKSESKVMILNNGLDFKEASSTATELQINENKKSDAEAICEIFNVPIEMIKGDASESVRINFIQYCITPILTELQNALDRNLLLESEKNTYFFAADTTELTKGDIQKRFNAYTMGVKNGYLQIDEVRRKENLEPLGFDFIKLGLQDVLYYPNTGDVYTPNTGVKGNVNATPTEVKDTKEIKEVEDATDSTGTTNQDKQ